MAEVDKSEKITINVGLVDLGQIDLLVDEGFYANRTDFIRTAIRRQLESRADAVNDTVARRTLILGTQHLSRHDLEQLLNAGRRSSHTSSGWRRLSSGGSPRRLPAVKAALATGTTTEPSHGAGPAVDVNITTHPEGLPWTATAPPVCRKH